MKNCKLLTADQIIKHFGTEYEVWIAQFDYDSIAQESPTKIKPIKVKFRKERNLVYSKTFIVTEYKKMQINMLFPRRYYVSENFEEVHNAYYNAYSEWVKKRKEYISKVYYGTLKSLDTMQINIINKLKDNST